MWIGEGSQYLLLLINLQTKSLSPTIERFPSASKHLDMQNVSFDAVGLPGSSWVLDEILMILLPFKKRPWQLGFCENCIAMIRRCQEDSQEFIPKIILIYVFLYLAVVSPLRAAASYYQDIFFGLSGPQFLFVKPVLNLFAIFGIVLPGSDFACSLCFYVLRVYHELVPFQVEDSLKIEKLSRIGFSPLLLKFYK